MGLRVRKTLRILPGVRLNLSKSGASLSVGGKGFTVNTGTRGTRETVGLPGSGVSYSKYQKRSGMGSVLWTLLLMAGAFALYYFRGH